jgi:hypothetical protein
VKLRNVRRRQAFRYLMRLRAEDVVPRSVYRRLDIGAWLCEHEHDINPFDA